MLACRFLNEPWTRVLTLPWGEILRCVYEGQRIEGEDGAGAQVRALATLTALIRG